MPYADPDDEQELVEASGACAYCGQRNVPLQIEHIQAESRGGTSRVSNLTLACASCNTRKGNRPIAEFLTWLSARLGANDLAEAEKLLLALLDVEPQAQDRKPVLTTDASSEERYRQRFNIKSRPRVLFVPRPSRGVHPCRLHQESAEVRALVEDRQSCLSGTGLSGQAGLPIRTGRIACPPRGNPVANPTVAPPRCVSYLR